MGLFYNGKDAYGLIQENRALKQWVENACDTIYTLQLFLCGEAVEWGWLHKLMEVVSIDNASKFNWDNVEQMILHDDEDDEDVVYCRLKLPTKGNN